jgi:prepilin-type processing-associated H-X9-DG protein
VLEANDSEVEGDELAELHGIPVSAGGPGTQGHSGGLNFLWMDGHVKWSRLRYTPGPGNASRWQWSFPPSDAGGLAGRGPWSPAAND